MRRVLPFTVLFCLVLAPSFSAQEADSARWEPAIRKFEEQDARSAPPPGGIVFVGSSSIVQWPRLAAAFPRHTIIQRGFGGSKLPDSTYFAERIIIKYKPDTVVLYSGENDLATKRTPEQVLEAFRAFVKKLHAALPRTRIIFIAIKPNPRRIALLEIFKKTNALIAEECSRDPLLTFLDIVPEMVDAEGKPRPELFRDGLHLNEKGYQLWEKKLAPLLDR